MGMSKTAVVWEGSWAEVVERKVASYELYTDSTMRERVGRIRVVCDVEDWVAVTMGLMPVWRRFGRITLERNIKGDLRGVNMMRNTRELMCLLRLGFARLVEIEGLWVCFYLID
jgi:hypothetical protein